MTSHSWKMKCLTGFLVEWNYATEGLLVPTSKAPLLFLPNFLPRPRSYFKNDFSCQERAEYIVDKGQSGHSERWMDSVLDVTELLRKGSSNIIKILPCLRLTGLRMALFFLARYTVP